MLRDSASGKKRKKKKIEMLWTGGWDSSFLLCKLAQEYDEVQPYYIKFGRPGQKQEIEATERIMSLLPFHPAIAGKVLPVRMIDSKDINIPKWMYASFESFHHKYKLGGQWLTIGAFAAQHPGIAVGKVRHYDQPGPLSRLLMEKGHIVFTSDGVGYLQKNRSDKNVYAVFGNAVYPVANITELEMKDMAEAWGVTDIMRSTWFCYYPIDGEPCGTCTPCVMKKLQHMDFLLPVNSQKRFFVRQSLDRLKQDSGSKNSEVFDLLIKFRSGMPLKWSTTVDERQRQKIMLLFQKFISLEALPLNQLIVVANNAKNINELLDA